MICVHAIETSVVFQDNTNYHDSFLTVDSSPNTSELKETTEQNIDDKVMINISCTFNYNKFLFKFYNFILNLYCFF